MPRIEVMIRGRRYPLDCGEGEEERLRKIAAFLDKEVSSLGELPRGTSETYVFLMAGLVIADQMFDLRETCSGLEREVRDLKKARTGHATAPARALNAAAERIERLAQNLTQRDG